MFVTLKDRVAKQKLQYLNKMVHLPNSNSLVANQILQHFHKCSTAEILLTAKGIFRPRESQIRFLDKKKKKIASMKISKNDTPNLLIQTLTSYNAQGHFAV